MNNQQPAIKLNTKQLEAVEHIDGPLLVIAGPGTGKTQLLSARVRRILEVTDTPANAILCLTFTDNGAQNMRDRLSQFIGDDAYQVQINTYHAFAQTIINQYPDFFVEKNLQHVIDPITKHQLIQQFIDTLPLNSILRKISTGNILSTIEEAKMALLMPNDLRTIADSNQAELSRINPQIQELTKNIKRFTFKSYQEAIDFHQYFLNILEPIGQPPISGIKSLTFHAYHELQEAIKQASEIESSTPLTSWRGSFLERNDQGAMVFKDNFNDARLRQLANCYDFYKQSLRETGLYDFSDMILETIETISSNEQLRANLQERYLYIMLDEYQDTNRAQSKLIELITDAPSNEGRPNVMAVGDDDQAIFAFQGADHSNMVNFYNHYRDTKIINLNQNYRSHQAILDFSEKIASKINDRLNNLLQGTDFTKQLVASNLNINEILIERSDFDSTVAENQWLTDKIASLIANGVDPNEIAVLALKHNTLRATTPYFLKKNIPIRYNRSQNIFDNIGIQALLKIAELIVAINNKQNCNQLLFEVFSYDIWQFDTADVWKLNWASGYSNYLSTIMTPSSNPDFEAIRQKFLLPVLWLLEFAKQTNHLSLEANFDLLIGNVDLQIKTTDNYQSFRSPLKQHFQSRPDEELFDFTLCVNLLRQRFLEFKESHTDQQLSPLELLIQLAQMHTLINEPILFTNPYSSGNSAVNLMTAFGSKGLEFKHVFLIETNQGEWGGSRQGRNILTLPDNLRFIRHEKTSTDDQLRLLFVAITRAKTHLYLLNSLTKNNGKPSTRLDFLSEVEAEDNTFYATTIPEAYSQIVKRNLPVTAELLENELIDNFTDWKNRHLQASLRFSELLRQRLDHLRLSPTSFNNYLDLVYGGPESFFFNNLLRFPSAFDLRTTYGSLVHSVLDHAQKMTDFTVEQAMALFEQKLKDYHLTPGDEAEIRYWGKTGLQIYLTQRQEIFQSSDLTVKTEVNFNATPIIVNGVHLTGAIDRIEIDNQNKLITIIDYKTGNPHLKFSESNATLYNNRSQLYFYKLLLQNSVQYSGYKINNWRLEFITPTVDNKIVFLEGEFQPDLEDRLLKLLVKVWQRIKEFDFKQPDLPASLSGRKQFEQQLLDEDSD
ncbi:MAG: ATP-dependent DNA helicase [Candidatus Saccharibacteria bacterium]|nr:ATP-dependent DNA helicase [Candidatus Saccharibacteria bacterium]